VLQNKHEKNVTVHVCNCFEDTDHIMMTYDNDPFLNRQQSAPSQFFYKPYQCRDPCQGIFIMSELAVERNNENTRGSTNRFTNRFTNRNATALAHSVFIE
jgi:hypothetical protein